MVTETVTVQDWSPELYAYLDELAQMVAGQIRARFPMCDLEDLAQEALLWAVKHPERLEQLLGVEDPMECSRRLSGAMRNAARDYARKIRVEVNHGDVSDDVWYRTEMLKGTGKTPGLLHHIFDDESWLYPENDRPEGEPARASKPDPAEGNNWLATLSDVSRAVQMIPPAEQGLLEWHYKHGRTYDEIGALCVPPVSRQTIMRRMDRAIRKVQDILGGPRPKRDPAEPGWEHGLVGTRRAITNSAARAITDHAYDD